MGITFSNQINVAKAERIDDKVRLSLDSMTIMRKGLLDYFATPVWYTDWYIYAPNGALIHQDTRLHSIQPVSERDEAHDQFTVEVESYSYYTVMLRGRYGSAVGGMVQKNVWPGVIPIPSLSPYPSEPEPSHKELPDGSGGWISPQPSPGPEPKPTPEQSPTPSLLGGLSMGLLVVLGLLAFSGGKKKK